MPMSPPAVRLSAMQVHVASARIDMEHPRQRHDRLHQLWTSQVLKSLLANRESNVSA